MRRNKGFTLIELLVVIAIIGLLSSVVLASLNQARIQARDSAIQSEMNSIRNAAEIYHSTNKNYGAEAEDCRVGNTTAVTFYDQPDARSIVNSISAKVPSGALNMRCNTKGSGTSSTWAMSAVLNNGKWWCVDSTGASKEITRHLAASPPEGKCP